MFSHDTALLVVSATQNSRDNEGWWSEDLTAFKYDEKLRLSSYYNYSDDMLLSTTLLENPSDSLIISSDYRGSESDGLITGKIYKYHHENLDSIIKKIYDIDSGIKNHAKEVIKYTPSGKTSSITYYDWTDGGWAKVSRFSYTYNQNDLQKRYIREKWLEQQADWELTYDACTYYGKDTLLDSSITKQFSDGVLSSAAYIYFSYDNLKRCIKETVYVINPSVSSEKTRLRRTTISYSFVEDSLKTDKVLYIWSNGEWVKTKRYLITSDLENKCVVTKTLTPEGNVEYCERMIRSFDCQGNILDNTLQYWEESTSSWIDVDRFHKEYNYLNRALSAEKTVAFSNRKQQVSINCSNNLLQIVGTVNGIYKIELYNLNGRVQKAMEVRFGPGKIHVPLVLNKSVSGPLIVRLRNSTGRVILSEKVIVGKF